MKELRLTQGFVAFVDDEDFEWISVYRWKVLKVDGKTYACRTRKLPGGGYLTILLHRVITDAPPKLLVDHRDGNGLNNVRSNLRIATQSHNLANTSSQGGTSRFKGVYWNKSRGKWQASIGSGTVNGKQKVLYLGRFDSEEEAAQAYDRKAEEMHGEFARPNLKPVGWTPPDIEGLLKIQGPIQ